MTTKSIQKTQPLRGGYSKCLGRWENPIWGDLSFYAGGGGVDNLETMGLKSVEIFWCC